MATIYLAVDEDQQECMYFGEVPKRTNNPFRNVGCWITRCNFKDLEDGTIEKILGRKISWDDEPIEINIIEIKS